MSPANPKIRSWLNIGLISALFAALLVSLLMMVGALQNSEHFKHLYSILLAINAIALIALLTLVVINLHHLLHQIHNKRAGAWLTVRLVSLLVILSTTPVIIVYYFSLEFLHQRLDNWFDVNVEQALSDALDLSRAVIDARMLEASKQVTIIADEISLLDNDMVALQLSELRRRCGASELTLFASNGRHIIASHRVDTEHLLPNIPNDSVLLQLKHSNSHINLEPIVNQGLHVRVIIKLVHNKPVRLLQALFPIQRRISDLVESLETATTHYRETAYLRQPLKLSFTIVLSLVLLLSIFSVVWIAFFAARRIVAPLTDLVEGTRAVANGDYEKQLPVKHSNELGLLVQSFNEMTRKIARARDEVKHSQQLADNQKTYLQTVLECLSSGVISLDDNQFLRTANSASAQILGLPLKESIGHSLTQLQDDYPTLRPFWLTIQSYLGSHAQDWREEVALSSAGRRKVLICRGTQLLRWESQERSEGYVIVFNDITTLIQAQRNAAWSEVARRLAHEIKNPLTPIQLSAERLRRKYLHKLPQKDAETLDRMTHTIIQQVDTMKEMVNAFSDYARTPTMHKEPLNFNQLIKEVLDLYCHVKIPINTELEENIPPIEADRGRLRQVLHNLIKNALEANSTDNCITITTSYLKEPCFECVQLRITDFGPGIPELILDKIFEPYATTKTKGTGLGLAIVKKIVEEHSGSVWIEQTEGTSIVIHLPVLGNNCEL